MPPLQYERRMGDEVYYASAGSRVTVGFGKEAAVARRPQAPGAVNAATSHGSAGHQLDAEPLLQPIGQRVDRGANHQRGDGGLRTREKL
jgi:hypothetical protein